MMDRINNASVYPRYLSLSLVWPALFEVLSERQPQTIYRLGGFFTKLISSHLIIPPLNSSQTCWAADWGITLLSHSFCVYYQATPINHSHWLAAALRPVNQQSWLVGHASGSEIWGADREREHRRRWRKLSEDRRMERKRIGISDDLFCRWREERKGENGRY